MNRIIPVTLALIVCSLAHAAGVNRPQDRSVGDPRVFAILSKQGFGNLARGATLTSICSIRAKDGRAGYNLFWLERLTQAAIVVHGNARIIAISQLGHVLGSYDSDMGENPRCIGGAKIARTVDGEAGSRIVHETNFVPGELPHWLGGGSGFFYPSAGYEGRAQVDGVKVPKPTAIQ
jgi:hypothetical protein